MGSYINPGYQSFETSIRGIKYVDKTLLIEKTNEWLDSARKLICMSRPRRFGKTLAATMLSAYYSRGYDSEHLFINRKIGKANGFRAHLNKHDIIYIDIGGEYSNSNREERANLMDVINQKVLREMKDSFPDVSFGKKDSLGEAIRKVYVTSGRKFIVILDEYDALVRENAGETLLNEYLLFLNGLFKSTPVLEAVSLAFLTGILPIVKDRVQSKLNNFKPQYTFLDAGVIAPFMGFTSDEVESLCKERNLSFAECRRWYDGYRQNGIELYNPESIMLYYETGIPDNYWSRTSTFRIISERLAANFDGMREDVIEMLSGGSIPVKTRTFLNTMTDFKNKDEAFTYLIHLGYLAYNREEQSCRIPNKEILDEWMDAIAEDDSYRTTNEIIQNSRKLLRDTLSGDGTAVADALDKTHIHVTSNRSYNNEDGLQCAIYLAYIYALNRYTVFREIPAGKGVADMVYIPTENERPALIIELKRKHSADSALKQIKEKKYFASLEHYYGKLLFIGIDYDEKSKSHSCKIERFIKEA